MDGSASHPLAHGGIAYCRDEIVRLEAVEKASAYQARSRSRPSSAVGLALYMSRGRGRDDVQGRSYDFSGRADELVHHQVLLPPGTPEALRDPVVLWSAAQAADMTKPRKGQAPRPKSGAQVAIATVLALPRALDLHHQIELVHQWCSKHYPDVAVQIDIHDPLIAAQKKGIDASRDDFPNIHTHLLRTTRKVGPDGLGKKIRPEDRVDGIRFNAGGRVARSSDWPKRWADFQNNYFKARGLDLRVAAVSMSPGLHLGKEGSRRKNSWARSENRVRQIEARAALHDADEWVAYLRDRSPVFDMRDITAIAHRHEVQPTRAKSISRDLSKLDLVEPLFDMASAEPVEKWRVRATDEPPPRLEPIVPPSRQAAAAEARRHGALIEEEALLVRLHRRLATLMQRLRRVLQAAERRTEATAARDGWAGGRGRSGEPNASAVVSSLFIHPTLRPADVARLERDISTWTDADRALCRKRTEQAYRITRNSAFARGLDVLDEADDAANRILPKATPPAAIDVTAPGLNRLPPDEESLDAMLEVEMAERAIRHQRDRQERIRRLRDRRQRERVR